jgi:hypothetical protein
MFKTTFLLYFFLVLSSAFAHALPGNDLNASKAEFNRLLAQHKKVGVELAKLGLRTELQISAWEKADEIVTKHRDGSKLSADEQQAFSSAQKVLDQTPEFLRTSKPEVRKHVKALKANREAITTLYNRLQSSEGNPSRTPAAQQQLEKNSQDLRISTIEAELMAQEISVDLELIEAKYDNHEFSAYVADKLAQFMNSDSFCRAKNHCTDRDKRNPVDPAILYDELFPNLKNEWKRKNADEVYDKVHKNKPREKEGPTDPEPLPEIEDPPKPATT